MRVLLTGHKGYLGTVMAPVLAAAGHEVVGLDSGLFDPLRARRRPPADPPGHDVDLRDVTPRARVRCGRRDPPGGAVERPARRAGPRPDLRHQPPRGRAARPAGPRQRRQRFLYASTCSVYGASGGGGLVERGRAAAPGHPVRGVEGPRRGRPARARRRRLHPGVPAQRHRVRLLAAAAGRHRAEQPGRPRLPVRRGAGALRRHAVAAAGARPATSPRRSSPRSPRRARPCTTRRSTSAPSATT